MATKKEMMKELIEDYGYTEEDLIDPETGNPFTNKELEEMIEEMKESIPEESKPDPEPEVKEVPKKVRRIERNEMVQIMNSTTGSVSYTSPISGVTIYMTDYGQTDEIEYGELVRMNNQHPKYLQHPFFIILDEDAVNQLGLSKLYTSILTPDELDRFLKLPSSKMKTVLEKMPYGMKKLVSGKALNGIANGTFDSVSKIRVIEEVCNVELLDR